MELRGILRCLGAVSSIVLTGALIAAGSPEAGASASRWNSPFPLSAGEQAEGPLLTFLPDGGSTFVWNRKDATVRVADRAPDGTIQFTDEFTDNPNSIEALDLFSNSSGTTALLIASRNRTTRSLKVLIRPPGGEFGDPETVVTSDSYPANAHVGLEPDGTLIVTWTGSIGGNIDGVFAWTKAPGSDETRTVRLGTTDSYLPSESVDTGPDGTTSVVWSRLGVPGGFSTRTRPPGGVFGPIENPVAAPNATVRVDGTGRSSFFYSCDGLCAIDREPGGTYGIPQTLPLAAGAWGFDVATAPDGRAIATWASGVGNDTKLFATEREPNSPFDQPEVISLSANGLADPVASIQADGTASVIWLGPESNTSEYGHEVEAVTKSPVGGFSAPAQIGNVDLHHDDLWLEAGQNQTTALWVTGGYGDPSSVGFADLTAGGFDGPFAMADSVGQVESVQIGFASGYGLAIWQRNSSGVPMVEQSSRNPLDYVYPNVTPLAGRASDPDLDSNGDINQRAAAVWVSDDKQIHGAISAGENLVGRVILSTTLIQPPQPSVAVGPQGVATAAWRGFEIGRGFTGPYNVVQTADFAANGLIAGPRAVSEFGEIVNEPQVAANGRDATTAIAWSGGLEPDPQIRVAIRRPGEYYGSPVTVSNPGVPAYDPVLEVSDNGQVIVAWTEGQQREVHVASSRSGGQFSTPLILSAKGRPAFGPDLAIDDSGMYTVTWREQDGSIWASSGRDEARVSRMISGASSAASNPAMDIGRQGKVSIVWRTESDQIWGSSSTQSGLFEDAHRISTSPAAEARPDVAVNSTGMSQAIWADESGAVYAAVEDGQILDCPAARTVTSLGVRRTGHTNHFRLRLRTSTAGRLTIASSKLLKQSTVRTAGTSEAVMPLRLRTAALRKLMRTGKLAISATVEFQPDDNCSRVTRKLSPTVRWKQKR